MAEMFREMEAILEYQLGPALSSLGPIMDNERSAGRFELVASTLEKLASISERFVALPTPKWLLRVHLGLIEGIRQFFTDVSGFLKKASAGGSFSATISMSIPDGIQEELERLFSERDLA